MTHFVLLCVLGDSTYHVLHSRIGPKQRGRPCTYKRTTVTNRLLLQLHLVREDTGSTWNDLQLLFVDLCKESNIPVVLVHPLIITVLRRIRATKVSDIEAFLSMKSQLEWIGDYSRQHQVSKELLLSLCGEQLDTLTTTMNLNYIPVGLLMEMNTFHNRRHYSAKTLLCWLQWLCPKFMSLTTMSLNQLVAKTTSKLKGKQKRKSDKGGAESLQEYKDSDCLPSVSVGVAAGVTAGAGVPSVAADALLPDSVSTSHQASTSCNCHSLMGKKIISMTAKSDEAFALKNVEIKALKEVLAEQKERTVFLQNENTKQKNELDKLSSKLNTSHKCVLAARGQAREMKRTISALKRANVYRRYCRLQTQCDNLKQQLATLDGVSSRLENERKKKRTYQITACKSDAKRRKLEEHLANAEDTIMHLLDQCENMQEVPETRTESGYYKDFVIKCIYQLIGECEVPAGRCRQVIQTVSNYIFSVAFPDDALPAKSSNLRFADQSHGLAKLQIADELGKQEFDLHCDGTSRSNKKFVGMQVTLKNKRTLCMGFDPVAHETAQTLLDLAINKLTEFAVLNSPQDSAKELERMLGNVVGFMSDRANTMKCVGRLLNEHITTALQKEIQIQFLHCNAHFLLGASTAAEKGLVQATKDMGLEGCLGRDNLPVFQGFSRSTESAVCRYIRMACDTIGPRGDEKCGCHSDWLAFCASHEKTSIITSYRGNRFNNLFTAAAGLIHHREDILNFFDLRQPSNLKQRSVHADVASDELNIMLLAVALVYVYFTGPFWMFVKSDIHYLDQYTYIQPMYFALKKLTQQPDMLLEEDAVPHDVESFRLRKGAAVDSVVQVRILLTQEQKVSLRPVMRCLAEELVGVTERQLCDFLADGKYGSPPTPELREKMQHCQLTNLLGEACFADLDYTMFKNRGATLHHHSTLNMVKRNKTVSSWLQRKSPDEQQQLMKKVRSLGPQLRRTHCQQQLIVWHEIAEEMERKKHQEEEDKARKEQKLRQQKNLIIQMVTLQGGPCQTAPDIISLLKKHRTKGLKMKAVKAQIDYHKIVLQATSAKLKTTKIGLMDLAKNLVCFLCGEDTATGDLAAACITQRKRRWSASADDSIDEQSDSEPVADAEPRMEEEIGMELADTVTDDQEWSQDDFHFLFKHQGQTVAVFYDTQFYIGQVLSVESPTMANITFMSRKDNTILFKWPEVEDLDQVSSLHVIYADFEIFPQNRAWQLQSAAWAALQSRWAAFQKFFCT